MISFEINLFFLVFRLMIMVESFSFSEFYENFDFINIPLFTVLL